MSVYTINFSKLKWLRAIFSHFSAIHVLDFPNNQCLFFYLNTRVWCVELYVGESHRLPKSRTCIKRIYITNTFWILSISI